MSAKGDYGPLENMVVGSMEELITVSTQMADVIKGLCAELRTQEDKLEAAKAELEGFRKALLEEVDAKVDAQFAAIDARNKALDEAAEVASAARIQSYPPHYHPEKIAARILALKEIENHDNSGPR